MKKVKTRQVTKFPIMLPLAAAVAVMMVVVAVVSSRPQEKKVLAQFDAKQISNPFLAGGATEPTVSAKSTYAVDVDTGTVLYYKDADIPMLPASTTKIATALVVLQHYSLDDLITVGDVSKISGQKMGLRSGEIISARSLLEGLLIYSANDAAEILARNYPGGRGEFILAMNKLTDSLNLARTHFTNPTGVDAYLHFSTARDLATLTLYAIKNPVFSEIVATRRADVSSLDGKIVHNLVSTNKLVGEVPGVIGIKTGTTENSGESLITLVDRNGHKVLVVLLDSDNRFDETKDLIEWIYANYSWDAPKN